MKFKCLLCDGKCVNIAHDANPFPGFSNLRSCSVCNFTYYIDNETFVLSGNRFQIYKDSKWWLEYALFVDQGQGLRFAQNFKLPCKLNYFWLKDILKIKDKLIKMSSFT